MKSWYILMSQQWKIPMALSFRYCHCASSSKYYAVSNKLEKFMDVIVGQTRTPSYSVVTVDNENSELQHIQLPLRVLDTFAIVKR